VSVEGVRWTVLDATVVDGDTVRLVRERHVELDGRRFLLVDDPEDPRGVPVRLVWVDTPERGSARWYTAKGDLIGWVLDHLDGLEVVCYESGGFDRLLGDLVAADGSSASVWLMTEGDGGAGWPAYVPR
jgi:endonuclease YncB( thermonuclease family)